MGGLAARIVRRWFWVLGAWLGVLVVLHQIAPPWDSITQDGDFAYLPKEMTSVRGERLLEAAFPQGLSKSQVAIVVARPDGPLNAFDFAVADRLERLLTPPDDLPTPITHLWSYQSEIVGRRLMRDSSQGGQAVLLVLHLKTEFMAIENMRLLRCLHRTTEAVQLEQLLAQALHQQQESRKTLREWQRRWLRKDSSGINQELWTSWMQQQKELQQYLEAYSRWFWSRPAREIPIVEQAWATLAEAAYGCAQVDLAELIGQAERLRSESVVRQAEGWPALLEKQDRLLQRLERLQKSSSQLLEAMFRLAVQAAHSLDEVPTAIQTELTELRQAIGRLVDSLPAETRLAAQAQPLPAADDASPGGLRIGLSGSAAVGSDMLFASWESIRNTEWVTVVLVVLVLLVVYRAPGLVLIPLGVIVISMLLATDLVALAWWVGQRLGWEFMVFKTTRIFIVVLVFGAGTDFCLFLISRYKEELQRGREMPRAITHALAGVSDALAASALTTVLGLATMAFADFGKFRNGGPVIAFCLLITLIASMTLAPAMLRAVGRNVFWPLAVRESSPSSATEKKGRGVANGFDLCPERGFWPWVAQAVLARPGWILLGTLVVLAPLAVRGAGVWITYDLLSELPSDRPSVRGTRLLEQFFLPGETGPITILAEADQPLFAGPEGRRQIAQLTAQLFHWEYTDSEGRTVQPIVSVRSLVEPLGGPPGSLGLGEGFGKLVAYKHPKAKARFLAQAPGYEGRVTRFDLICQYNPFSRESMRLLEHVENYLYQLAEDPQSPWYGIQFHLAGTTAAVRDLSLVTASDQQRIQRLVVVAVLAVLILILRRVVISLVMILSVVFGYFVTMGLTEWVFRWWYGSAFDGLDWKVPIFLFVILIAVGQDYNIYLATRAFEEERRRGWREGLRVALIRTGGIITSCGVIMAGTFASMLAGSLRAMQELGFALAMGVLLDTLLIRTVFMPAFLSFWARWWNKLPNVPEDSSHLDLQEPSAPTQKESSPLGLHLPGPVRPEKVPSSPYRP